MTRLRRAAIGGIAIVCALAFPAPPARGATAVPPRGNFSGPVAIGGGRRLYVVCRGSGRPTVILEAGLRVRSDYWSENVVSGPQTPVLPGVARFTRVCAYDRPGTVIGLSLKDRSRSDDVRMPRSAIDAVADLHELLRALRTPGPVVLAGHSTGGLIALLSAYRDPGDVAGLVLVDALPAGLKRHLTRAQYATFLRLNVERDPKLVAYRGYETIAFEPSFAELRRAQAQRALRRMPLIVLSRGRPAVFAPGSVPPGFSAALERAWEREQAGLVKLEPGARRVVATRSEHYIMFGQADLIVRAIRDVVDAVRRDARRAYRRALYSKVATSPAKFQDHADPPLKMRAVGWNGKRAPLAPAAGTSG